MFHVKRPLYCPEARAFRLQGSDDQLSLNRPHLLDQGIGMSDIQLGCRIIKQQCRRAPSAVCDQSRQRQNQGRTQQFLLAARKDFPGCAPVHAKQDIKALWTYTRRAALLIANPVQCERLGQCVILRPAPEMPQRQRLAEQILYGLVPVRCQGTQHPDSGLGQRLAQTYETLVPGLRGLLLP